MCAKKKDLVEAPNPVGQRVEDVEISTEMERCYIDYAMSVIVGRALPDARDGLKPVHRRILYSMDEMGVRAGSSYRKSAGIVGDVMGKYHPHGDASIYDAMARLAQDFSTRYPLVDGQGNFGSIDGDSPAAMRYTEARLSKLSAELMRDIGKETVDFMPNYDERLKEPVVLPARIPNLLVNGSNGIAVGMATNIPPHNLGEVIEATIALMENEELTSHDLMKYIKGPDFPTGGIIMGREGLNSAYTTGRGRLKVRAKATIEQVTSTKQKIVVTEIPYMVNKAVLVSKIADLVKDKKIVGISDIHDFSDRNGIKIEIELKRDISGQVVLNQLYKFTQLEDTFGVIMLALVDNKPKILSLKEALDVYIKHQKEVIKRRTQYDLDKALARAHILEGYIIALDNIDEVIQVIRSSYDDAEERLMARFGLSAIQAKAIVDMQLRRLQGLEREKIENEYNQLQLDIKRYREILASEALVIEIIRDELNEIKAKYNDPRRTQFENDADEIDIEDLIEEEDVVVTITHVGYVKRVSANTYKAQRRGGKGITAHSTRENDFVEKMYNTTTHDYLLFFSNKGKVYKLKAYELPDAGRTAKGSAIVNLLPLEQTEKITAVIPVKKFDENKYLLMATRKGLIKKTPLSEYNSGRKSGIIGITLSEDDELFRVLECEGNEQVILGTKDGMSIRFECEEVRSVGRTAVGVRGIKIAETDEVVGMDLIDDSKYVLSVCENGIGKLTKSHNYHLQKRAGKGVTNYKITNKTGSIVGIAAINKKDEDIMLISDNGVVIRMNADDVSTMGRAASGVKLMDMKDSKIVSFVVIPSEKEEEEQLMLDGVEPAPVQVVEADGQIQMDIPGLNVED